jgi:phosphoribosyl-AMP cyclohydrolase
MTSNRPPSIVAYGAAAEQVPALTPWQRTRAAIKHAHYLSRDRARWKKGDLSALDYRNYQDVTSVNRGDQAIVDSITSKIAAHMHRVDFVHKN